MDAHLILVPGLGTLTVGGLAGGDLQGLGGQTDGALDLQGLATGTVDELGADLLKGGDLAGGEGDADLVDLLYSRTMNILVSASFSSVLSIGIMLVTYGALAEILLGLLERHFEVWCLGLICRSRPELHGSVK